MVIFTKGADIFGRVCVCVCVCVCVYVCICCCCCCWERCPSPIHPEHFPCTMLQQNQQHREGPLPQSLPAPTIRKTVPEHQSPLRQTAQQLFPPDCESPEPKSPRPPLKKKNLANPYLLKHGPYPPSKHLTTPKKKTVNFFFVQFKCATHRWVGLYKTTCSNTLSSMRTRHFSSHCCVYTISQKTQQYMYVYMLMHYYKSSCTVPQQLLDSQCFSLHMYSIYVKHSHSLYFLSFIFSCIG